MDRLIPNNWLLFLIPAVFLVGVVACVEPLDINFITTTDLIVIDGKIDDSGRDLFISVKKSIAGKSSNAKFSPIDSAKVEIIENETTNYKALNLKNGQYSLPIGFKAKTGNRYQLSVTLPNGQVYKSSNELLKTTPEINKLTINFDYKAVQVGEVSQPGHVIYLDTRDNPEKGDYYIWNYRIFEKQPVCQTCYGGIYVTSPFPLGKCQTIQSLADIGNIYDYGCDGNCWEILNSADLNIMSDAYINDGEIKNRLIARVPYYSSSGFLIEVSQQNVNPQAFRYLKILLEQNQTNGTLADSPPAALIGNIKNINHPEEIVGGYFIVGGSKIKRQWVPRSLSDKVNPVGLLDGRNPNFEPSTLTRPPLAPCVNSKTRTPLAPEGWPL